MPDIRLLNNASQFTARTLGTEGFLRGTRICAAAADLTEDGELLTAALLIPIAETRPDALPEMRRLFGERVFALCRAAAVSDTGAGWQRSRLKELTHLRIADRDECLITLARALAETRMLCATPDAPRPSLLGWYYISLRDSLRSLYDTESYREFGERVERLFK